jgi:phospholipid/cholesterol/gamma-HCH transport system permease protein
MPVLTVFADAVGMFGGYVVSVYLLGSNPTIYLRRTYDYLDLEDIYIGLLKACAFGMIIAIIGCYQGFNAQGGAEGVGKATTRAVVLSSLLILIANYFITALFF